ncbi:ATP phosphoribosyltransferase [Ileibacterium valens]|uniref:ATP phosphoribosyltransferase n=2 Tax=Ileibacterium valens TaxID=1862668 RepID=A0A1U7NDC7_9FIRM|nr:ATP phosphoribosyltransferase [Ileibacterium valens]OLU36931.1 ATP phosphoribosyltransferase [Ileibacterium valens]OLU37243.1 ATP phosphoribosyltransferase [Erysipelotrichaceae bacterium NYU-BL-F16]OLU38637.1 ATP phosphoribosyltransferase [Erysipelotrichaceae bacterium NYU-BL-E8]
MSLRMALTKGRLETKTADLLEQMGYGVENLRDKGRALVLPDTKNDIDYVLVKSNDCITYVEHGVADLGVVGKDTLMEGEGDYYEMLDLKIGKCCFICAGLPENNPLEKQGHVTIGTKYPKVARDYFASKNIDVEIIKIDGSVELSPLLGLVDGIVDIMETGNTLRANGLVVFDTCAEISARVIVNKASFKLKKNEVMKVLEDLERAVSENAECNR